MESSWREAGTLAVKLATCSAWLLKNCFKHISNLYKAYADRVQIREAYESVFLKVKQLFGSETALKLCLEHRKTLSKLSIHHIVDQVE